MATSEPIEHTKNTLPIINVVSWLANTAVAAMATAHNIRVFHSLSEIIESFLLV